MMNDTHSLLSLIDELTELRAGMVREEATLEYRLEEIPDQHRDSARNLVHYLALRRHDIRDLQEKLTANGLSSLGRAEADVLGAVDAALGVLHRLVGEPAFAGVSRKGREGRAFADGSGWNATRTNYWALRRRTGTCELW